MTRPDLRAMAQPEPWLAAGVVVPKVDLSPEEARAALSVAPHRRQPRSGAIEVLYEGRWLTMARTDLQDDVRCRVDPTKVSVNDPLGYFRRSALFGARVYDGMFAVIDRRTDA